MAADILAIVLGGLGASQMGDVWAALMADPRIVVPETPAFNGYAADITQVVRNHSDFAHVALIGHSFAAIPILQAAAGLWCSYVALIDPVSSEPFIGTWDLPARPLKFDWFRRDPVGMKWGFWEVPLEIRGAVPEVVRADPALAGRWDLHNELPHQAGVIGKIVKGLLAACMLDGAPTITEKPA